MKISSLPHFENQRALEISDEKLKFQVLVVLGALFIYHVKVLFRKLYDEMICFHYILRTLYIYYVFHDNQHYKKSRQDKYLQVVEV